MAGRSRFPDVRRDVAYPVGSAAVLFAVFVGLALLGFGRGGGTRFGQLIVDAVDELRTADGVGAGAVSPSPSSRSRWRR